MRADVYSTYRLVCNGQWKSIHVSGYLFVLSGLYKGLLRELERHDA